MLKFKHFLQLNSIQKKNTTEVIMANVATTTMQVNLTFVTFLTFIKSRIHDIENIIDLFKKEILKKSKQRKKYINVEKDIL